MVKVNWDQETCQHAGVCVNELPAVFKVEDGNFVIDPSAAEKEEIQAVCEKCPSGALSMSEE